MSLIDLVDRYRSNSPASFSTGSKKKKPVAGFDFAPAYTPPSTQAATSSRERGVPERIDVNRMFGGAVGALTGADDGRAGGVALQAIEVAGRAPGFIYERPIAAADAIVKGATGESPVRGLMDAIGGVPILGALVGGAGDALMNISSLPAALQNAAMARILRENAGLDDSAMIRVSGDRTRRLGDIRAEARKMGFTDDEVRALVAGTKSDFDFGDHSISGDPLSDFAFRVVADPLNLLLGAGLATKAAKGVGLLAKSVDAGGELARVAPAIESGWALALGRDAGKLATAAGVAKYLGGLYQKTAIGLSAGQIGLEVGANVIGGAGGIGEDTAIGGWMESLVGVNRAIIDNQPLSDGMLFSLVSAYHFPYTRYTKGLTQKFKDAKYKLTGAGTYNRVYEAIGVGKTLAEKRKWVNDRLGGPEAFQELIYHTHLHIVFDDLNPKQKDVFRGFDSFTESTLKNVKLRRLLDDMLEERYRRNDPSVNGKATAARIKRWYEEREGVPNHIRYEWDSEAALDRWNRYRMAALPLSKAFKERGDAVLGLAEYGQLTREDLVHVRTVLGTAARSNNGLVSYAEVQRMLDVFPQLLSSKHGDWFAQFLTDRNEQVAVKRLFGKLRALENETPSVRELTHEHARAERMAPPSPDGPVPGPMGPDGIRQSWEADGGASISVSRWNEEKWGVRNTVSDAMRERSRPEVQVAEAYTGDVLSDAGFAVAATPQSIGSFIGKIEPSLNVLLGPGTRLQDARLAAALLGKQFDQHSAIIIFSGQKRIGLGLPANGLELTWQLPTKNRAVLEAVAKLLSDAGFAGWSIDDSIGLVRIGMKKSWVPENFDEALLRVNQGLGEILPKDLVGDTGVRHSIRHAYVEDVGAKLSDEADFLYSEVIRANRRDPRVQSFRHHARRLSVQGRRSRVARAGRSDAGPVRPAAGGGGGGPDTRPAAAGVTPEPWRADPRSIHAEMVPVSELVKLREFDRAAQRAPGRSPEHLAELVEDIRQNGIREPLIVYYDDRGRMALLGDGNHRVAAAEQLGIDALPVRVSRAGTQGKGLPVRGKDPDVHGYVPADMKPSDIGLVTTDSPLIERVGVGDVSLIQAAEPGYLYHTTEKLNLNDIAGDALRPQDPGFRGEQIAWPDGGTGKRIYFTKDPRALEGFQPEPGAAILRVKEDMAGRVANERGTGDQFTRRKITADRIEILGADGQWYPLRDFMEDPRPAAAEQLARRTREDEAGAARMTGQTNEAEAALLSQMAELTQPVEPGTARSYLDTLPNDPFPYPEAGYLYHGTPRANLESIAQKGVEPRHGEFSYWSTEQGGGTALTAFGDALVRTKVQDDFQRLGETVESAGTFNRLVPPADLEFWGADGRWHPMADLHGRALTPENAAAMQELNLAVEMARGARGEAVAGQVTFNRMRDQAVDADIPLPQFYRRASGAPDDWTARYAEFEAQLRDVNPSYTTKVPPKLAIFYEPGATPAMKALRERTVVGEWLADRGPLSGTAKFWEWLTAPVKNVDLRRATRQAIYEQLLPHGAKPAEVDRFFSELDARFRESRFAPGVRAGSRTYSLPEVNTFRDPYSMLPNQINSIAKQVFSDKTTASVNGNYHILLDRAANRFIRHVDDKIRQGKPLGRLERAMNTVYTGWQQSTFGDAGRFVGKTAYLWYRFILDPRWWAMNAIEADVLAGTRYGINATALRGAQKAGLSEAAGSHLLKRRGIGPEDIANVEQLTIENGLFLNRHYTGYVSRSFDAARPESGLSVLRELSDSDPVLRQLRRRYGGDEDIVKAIDDTLYSFDRKGVKETVVDAAQQAIPEEMLLDPQMQHLVQKVWERNQQTFDALLNTLTGNSQRTTLERLANSYWLFWPISYQLKAARWLYEVTTDKIAGKQTNLAGAATYAEMVERHRERFTTDPDYRQMFEDNETLWFAAQMLIPITPGDLGVSLSRAPRYLGGELGLWGEYKAAEDPLVAASAILTLGPAYTLDLLERISSETLKGGPDETDYVLPPLEDQNDDLFGPEGPGARP